MRPPVVDVCRLCHMDLSLDRKTVEERLRNFTANNYSSIYGILKNVALAIAALVLTTFLQDRATLVPRFSFWAATIAFLTVTHLTAARGVLLANFRYNWLDFMIPLSMGMVECLLFYILMPNSARPQLWLDWYFLAALHMFLAVILVINRLKLTRVEDFAEDLQPLIIRFTSWLRGDAKGAGICCVITIIIGLVMRLWILPRWPEAEWWQFLCGLCFISVMCVIVATVERQRKQIISFIQNQPMT